MDISFSFTFTLICSYTVLKSDGRTLNSNEKTDQIKNLKTGHETTWTQWKDTFATECSVTCGGGTRSVTRRRKCMFTTKGCSGPAINYQIQLCKTQPCPTSAIADSSQDDKQEDKKAVESNNFEDTTQTNIHTAEELNAKEIIDGLAKQVKMDENARYNKKLTEEIEDRLEEIRMKGLQDISGGKLRDDVTGTMDTVGEGGEIDSVIYSPEEAEVVVPKHKGVKVMPGDDASRKHQRVYPKTCVDDGESFYCKVNGQWGNWYLTEERMLVTCGWGTVVRTYWRYCDSPAPAYGGKLCPGGKSQTMTKKNRMYRTRCPVVHGHWTEWVMQSAMPCSKSCNGGEQTVFRVRSCVPPKFGGKPCFGSAKDRYSRACNTQDCVVPSDFADNSMDIGMWSEWKVISIGQCSKVCGGGLREIIKRRTCLHADEGPAKCEGPNDLSTQYECNTQACTGAQWTK